MLSTRAARPIHRSLADLKAEATTTIGIDSRTVHGHRGHKKTWVDAIAAALGPGEARAAFMASLAKPPTPKVATEVVGLQFERAICAALTIPYVGAYKYDAPSALLVDAVRELLLTKLPWAARLVHTAARGATHDFSTTDAAHHLSAKSNKSKSGKVAPQRIGQASPGAMALYLGVQTPDGNDAAALEAALKEALVNGNKARQLLKLMAAHTFALSPTIHLDVCRGEVVLVKLADGITLELLEARIDAAFDGGHAVWTRSPAVWVGSSTLKLPIKAGAGAAPTAIVEVQFHHASRANMACRWAWRAALALFDGLVTTTTRALP